MAWAKMDDSTWSDPRMTALSDAAWRLYWCATSYCADKLTDGLLGRRQLEQVAAINGLRKFPALLDELAKWGLLNQVGELWEVDGYLLRNPNAEEVKKRWADAHAAKSAGGTARAQSAARTSKGRFQQKDQQPAGEVAG